MDGGVGWLRDAPTHVHMHAHACMHMHTHIHITHDNFNCKWLPPLDLGNPRDSL